MGITGLVKELYQRLVSGLTDWVMQEGMAELGFGLNYGLDLLSQDLLEGLNYGGRRSIAGLHRRGDSNEGGVLYGGGGDLRRRLFQGGRGVRRKQRMARSMRFCGWRVRWLGLMMGRRGAKKAARGLGLGKGVTVRAPINGSLSVEGEKRGQRLSYRLRVFRGGHLGGIRRQGRGREVSFHGVDRIVLSERLKAAV
ncbi:hypothetical protein LIER_43522 [Lithospermum erythrorhizon]|uniref:Uncharacterized protein n=1 Tax=Lithospermum erythrorhizon TaxID=34254 RepID=A0AAV3Q8X5_LITER